MNILPSKESQPNSLHIAFSEVRQAEREAVLLTRLSHSLHSSVLPQDSQAPRSCLCPLFSHRSSQRGTGAFPISPARQDQDKGHSEHWRMSSARLQLPGQLHHLFFQEGFLDSPCRGARVFWCLPSLTNPSLTTTRTVTLCKSFLSASVFSSIKWGQY